MRKPVNVLSGLKQILVAMSEYQVSSRAIRGMLALTFCVVTQIFSMLVFNSLRKSLIKRLTYNNIIKLYKMALQMALELAGNCFNKH